jgi:hypothetical protein
MKRQTLSGERSGARRLVFDSSNRPRLEVLLYNNTGGTLTVDRPYLVRFDGDEEVNPQVIVPVQSAVTSYLASGAMTPEIVVIAQEATVNQAWGWMCLEGYCNIMVEGTVAVAKDDHLKLSAATATSLIKDTDFANGVYNVAVACAAKSGAGSTSTLCYLIGKRSQAVA